MSMKRLKELPEDIYKVFTEDHTITETNLEQLGTEIMESVRTKIVEATKKRPATLRMSNIGKPDRQLWYELDEGSKGVLSQADQGLTGDKFMMFLYGDILESLLVFFLKEAGHTIEFAQEELEINGIVGHTDGVVDGVTIDFKSASTFSYSSKFLNGGLLKHEGDPFGYIGQLSGYKDSLVKKFPDKVDPHDAAWIAINKENGKICILPTDMFGLINAEDRVDHLKEMTQKSYPPMVKCYKEKPEGKAGNMVLSNNCGWCKFKGKCWSDANGGTGLRGFKYSNGTKWFTQVVKLPRVSEIIGG